MNRNSSLSVVMPVHNGRPFLDESIRSILNQTLTDFEFVILDDASTDDSASVLLRWAQQDSRIRLIRSERKLGLGGSSNLVVQKAGGDVLARMDADDISHPERLQRQWTVLQSSPDVVAVGTLFDGINAAGRHVRPRDRWRLVRHSRYVPFAHGSAMFRREAFEASGGYCEDRARGEDQDFFFKMTRVGRVVTLPDVLYHYRYHTSNATLLPAVAESASGHGDDLAACYLLGAMRLWSGHPPAILPQILKHKSLKFDVQSLVALASASLGSVSPATLRLMLRGLIHSRDFLAGFRVRDGVAYDWRTARDQNPTPQLRTNPTPAPR